MVQIEEKDFENLKKEVVSYLDQVYPDKHMTFKVDSRRADKKYPVPSEQMNRDLGEVILNAYPEMKVDVHHPEVLLRVEVRTKVNIYSEMIPGTWRNAGGNQWKGNASVIRRYRQPGSRLHDRKTRRED